MQIIAFIEDRRVVCAILEHLRLWDEPRPPPVRTAAVREPLELEYLPCVERSSEGGAAVCRVAVQVAALPARGGSARTDDLAEP